MTEDEARNLFPLARKLEARAMVLKYLRERDEKASKAVLSATNETWERKVKAMHKARSAWIEAQTGLGWVPHYDRALKAQGSK